MGLLPATTRSQGGFRIYTVSDLQRMPVIRSMKPPGFTLDEMRGLLQTVETLALGKDDKAARSKLGEFSGRVKQKRGYLALKLAAGGLVP